MNAASTSTSTIYDQMINDLQVSERDLLSNGKGKTSSLAASALLARVYLYLGNWQLALEKAETVLGSGFDLSTFPYLEDEIMYLRFTPSDGNVLNFWYGPSELGGRHDVQPSTFLMDAFETEDVRRAATFDGSFEIAMVPYVTKYDDFDAGISDSGTDPVYLFRYAEQLLIAAESEAELGDFNKANKYYNQVRLRAGLAPKTLNTNNFEDLILQERLLELAFEGPHRLFDLRRRGKAREVLMQKEYQPCHDVWPLPQAELDRNPNLVQNGCCNC